MNVDDGSTMDSLEELTMHKTYEAIFESCDEGLDELFVRIPHPSTTGKHHKAKVIVSNNPRWSDRSNKIRQRVIEQRGNAEPFNVMIIDGPFLSDKYITVASIKSVSRARKYDITAEEAFAVLKGKNIFYAIYADNGEKGNPALVGYRYPSKTRVFGFVKPVEYGGASELTFQRRWAERIITNEILVGSKNNEALKQGDYLIARQIGSNSSNTFFFEPVVNFMDSDEALSPEGKHLITRVDKYKPGDIIHNLLILYTQQDRDNIDKMVGVGYVRRPEDEGKHFYYKQVRVKGTEGLKRKYVPKARIIANGPEIILAKKMT